jgi:ParB family chromosome partitioning protein
MPAGAGRSAVPKDETDMEKKPRLGRGLDALLSSQLDDQLATAIAAPEVPVEAIENNPYQPRKTFDEDELAALSNSIRTHGVLQPLVVRQVGGRFQLIAGERRLRAARSVGLSAVPVRVVDFNDQQTLEAALIENIQRADLNPVEKATGFADYLARFKMTHEQLARRLGLARSTITNLLALLDMPPEIQNAVRVGQLTLGHAKLLKGVGKRERQVSLFKEIIARGLSVHATEALLRQQAAEATSAPTNSDEPADNGTKESPFKTTHVVAVEDELRKKLGVKVEIKVRAKDKGQFVLAFESNDDFERLVEVLRQS